MSRRLSSDLYWAKRFLQIARDRQQADLRYIEHMRTDYRKLERSMTRTIREWVRLYADNEGITENEAREMLNLEESRNWQMSLSEFRRKAKAGGFDQELNREYFNSRVTRLEQLKGQLYLQFAEMAHKETQRLQSYLLQTMEETHLRTTYEIHRLGNFGNAFHRYNEDAMRYALSKPWKGGTFSSRVWGNLADKLPDKLMDTFSHGIIHGWGIDRLVAELQDDFDGIADYRLVTLVQTESAHIAEVATHQSYLDMDVDRYQWLATLEANTCDREIIVEGTAFEGCGGLDMVVFRVRKNTPFLPPVHPNCRCTTIPYIEGNRPARWMRDPETGKGKVIDFMTFEQWKKQYVA